MPKAFNDREKELIRQRLLEKGRELFETYGLRKTNVEDLTRAAGISKGAFYLFYQSKEQLFVDVLGDFEDRFRQVIFDEAFHASGEPRERLRRTLQKAYLTWRASPLLSQFHREDYEMILGRVPQEQMLRMLQSDEVFMAEFAARWAAEGVTLHGDSRTINGLLKSLFYVSLHEEDFGPDVYPQTMETLLDLVVAYLIP